MHAVGPSTSAATVAVGFGGLGPRGELTERFEFRNGSSLCGLLLRRDPCRSPRRPQQSQCPLHA
eukprot:15354904-Alexandrium_andersonii.AAC.1